MFHLAFSLLFVLDQENLKCLFKDCGMIKSVVLVETPTAVTTQDTQPTLLSLIKERSYVCSSCYLTFLEQISWKKTFC